MSTSYSTEVSDQFNEWSHGYRKIQHTKATVRLVEEYLQRIPLESKDGHRKLLNTIALLKAADRICSASMWLVAHMTYAKRVPMDGSVLSADDFKKKAQGHTGGALNMTPAYTGYLLANSLSGKTRSWVMGQGHCVAAIEAVNAIIGNQYEEKAKLYSCDEQGLSRLCRDYYSYELDKDGELKSRIGSHVNIHTAGGISEGGYLGFTALQYSHMPLPGQELVAFLSDGAFEEQRGSDWAPRWWRAADTGLVTPVMIENGRKIDQRTLMAQEGGTSYFEKYLKLHDFNPLPIDGSDPAAYAMALLNAMETLSKIGQEAQEGRISYPVKLPYIIAEVVKGYGLPAAGTNAAHNLPLGENLVEDDKAREEFINATAALYVSQTELEESVKTLNNHSINGRVREKDHELRLLKRRELIFPDDNYIESGLSVSCLREIDKWFSDLIHCNKSVRFRLGNPDEVQSNKMTKTLASLKHRVANPENNETESITGGVISALNEEAVVSAVLANKQGVGMVVSYEAFAMKMIGAMRQEVIFSRNLKKANRPAEWISIPVIATSHTWENGKNEQSHQDPKFSENWLCEMSDISPVYFPIDANTSKAILINLYKTRGKIAAMVASKKALPVVTTGDEAATAANNGVFIAIKEPNADIQLIAIGGYQLQSCLKAAKLLQRESVKCEVVALLEPGRFRVPRDETEAEYCHDKVMIDLIIAPAPLRIVVSHTGEEVITGVLRRLDLGTEKTTFMGYKNQGGTLNLDGMLKVNGQSERDIESVAKKMLSTNK